MRENEKAARWLASAGRDLPGRGSGLLRGNPKISITRRRRSGRGRWATGRQLPPTAEIPRLTGFAALVSDRKPGCPKITTAPDPPRTLYRQLPSRSSLG